ncbi:MAG: transglycosylase domain-containing protein [Flavobacteriia bacterium]|nr:transglycosylase domain-containing protein [Flavobacteriia bacterium]
MAKQKKQRSKKMRIFIWLLKAGGIGFATLIVLFLLVWVGAFGHLANKEEIASIRNYLASEVYSSDNQLIGKYFVQNRTGADYEEIPEYLIHALIATEDARFYEHDGVDGRSLARVVFKTILMGDASSGGGSTITQQLVKNTYGRGSYGFLSMPVAKMKEWILAQRFEEVFSKEQILELYLNTVSFGEGVYGIETASQRYFNEKPQNLNMEECAVLVGLLKGNTLYNPRRNPELAEERRNTVLAQMAKYEYISDREKDSLVQIPLEINYYNLENDNPAPYFIDHIEDEISTILEGIQKPDGSNYDLRTDGLVIETTLDSRLQRYAVDAVESHMKRLQAEFNSHWNNSAPWGNNNSIIKNEILKTGTYRRLNSQGISNDSILKVLAVPHPMSVVDLNSEDGRKTVEMSAIDSIAYYQAMLHCGFVAMDPATGNVKAWVGGIDFQIIPYDHVTTRRQVASTFKPFVYGAAIEQGIDDCDYFRNVAITYTNFENYTPTNAGGDDSLYYNLSGALKRSLNVVSVQVLLEAGMENVQDFARRAGIQSPIKKVPSMALGTNEATLLEMVTAYSTFANRGRSVRPHYITRIKNAFGDVIYTAPSPTSKEVMKRSDVEALIAMMEGVVNAGTASSARSAYGLQSQYAGKTGTAQNYSDGWFIGFSPKLVAGAWVGASNPSVHFRSGAYGSGAHMALPIWAKFFRNIERTSLRNTYTGSFNLAADSTLTIDCPEVREPDLLERIDNWFDNGEEEVDTTGTEERSFWDKVFGRG